MSSACALSRLRPKTFEVFAENLRWNKIMGLENAGDVNMACSCGAASDLIKVAEALQEKKIVQIAEEIEQRVNSDNPIKMVLITGPSSSGKSTFCKRLSIQLKACGICPISFSTPDLFSFYFIFSCLTLCSMTWREASSLRISSQEIFISAISTRTW